MTDPALILLLGCAIGAGAFELGWWMRGLVVKKPDKPLGELGLSE